MIETHDEQRVVELLKRATEEDSTLGTLRIWSAAEGVDLYRSPDMSRWQVEGLDRSRDSAAEIERMCTHFELSMPSTEQITALVKREAKTWAIKKGERVKGDPQAIVSAGYWAHAQEESLATDHILRELESTRPLSVVRAESIAALRNWAEGRTVRVD